MAAPLLLAQAMSPTVAKLFRIKGRADVRVKYLTPLLRDDRDTAKKRIWRAIRVSDARVGVTS
jgi:hypothetical protein